MFGICSYILAYTGINFYPGIYRDHEYGLIYVCHLGIYTWRLLTDVRQAAMSTKLTRGYGSLGAASSAWRGCQSKRLQRRRMLQRMLCSRDKTGSQDGSSLIQVKGWQYRSIIVSMFVPWCIWYIVLYADMFGGYIIDFLHTCFFHFWLQAALCAWRMYPDIIQPKKIP